VQSSIESSNHEHWYKNKQTTLYTVTRVRLILPIFITIRNRNKYNNNKESIKIIKVIDLTPALPDPADSFEHYGPTVYIKKTIKTS